jgi:hypothetical protein
VKRGSKRFSPFSSWPPIEAATQSARVCAPEDFFVLLDGRVKPGHDEIGLWSKPRRRHLGGPH